MKKALNTDNAKESIRTSLMNRKIMARLVEIVQGESSASPASEKSEDSSEPDIEPAPEATEESTPAEKAAE